MGGGGRGNTSLLFYRTPACPAYIPKLCSHSTHRLPPLGNNALCLRGFLNVSAEKDLGGFTDEETESREVQGLTQGYTMADLGLELIFQPLCPLFLLRSYMCPRVVQGVPTQLSQKMLFLQRNAITPACRKTEPRAQPPASEVTKTSSFLFAPLEHNSEEFLVTRQFKS